MRIPHTIYQIKGRALIRRTIRRGQLERELSSRAQSMIEALRVFEVAREKGQVTPEMCAELRAATGQITKLKKQLAKAKSTQ
jgi:hypothetical protein